MPNESTQTTATTPTSYDLIALNNVSFPDVKKGEVTVGRNDKYNEYETEGGGKVIEPISQGKLRGTVSYDGLLQSEAQTLDSALDIVSEMTIYNPRTGNTRSFLALIIPNDMTKIIHDANANAWTFGFEFEEIGDIPT